MNIILTSVLMIVACAWKYPDCDPDGCYRNLIDARYSARAPSDCVEWISGTTTDADVIPTIYHNCPGVKAFSSACSCVAYTATHHISSTTTSYSPTLTTLSTTDVENLSTGTTTTTTEIIFTETAANPPGKTATTTESVTTQRILTPSVTQSQATIIASSAKSQKTHNNSNEVATEHAILLSHWTTSTVYTTSTYTTTKCFSTVIHCPAESTIVITSTIAVSTTVCPVTATTTEGPSFTFPGNPKNSTYPYDSYPPSPLDISTQAKSSTPHLQSHPSTRQSSTEESSIPQSSTQAPFSPTSKVLNLPSNASPVNIHGASIFGLGIAFAVVGLVAFLL